jgi:hypothetical protein
MVEQQTAMQTLIAWGDEMLLKHPQKILSFAEVIDRAEELLEMEKDQLKKEFITGYNLGYIDAECNHINDGENLANEREYLKESTCEYSGLRSVKSYEDPNK